ncbi:sigma-70 family RNA polymerase sigma factor [Bacillaceae bacterium Marseille-Q3522]|nr:sigma-70 family RNA polymerase sigma factor [Bacillaceae bacterium Marseille-Q3522]
MNRKLYEEYDDENKNRFLQFYPNLQRYAQFLTQNRWDGEDIAQEAILKAMVRYKDDNKISAALMNKIAYHHWIDTVRSRQKEDIDTVGSELSPGKSERVTEIIEAVEYLMKQTTPKQAVIFLLKEAFQYKAGEIADVIGSSETAVKAVLHRAKNQLSKGRERSQEIAPFWNEAEKEQLFELFYESLKAGEPSKLIRALPTIPSFAAPDITTSPYMMAA